MHKGLKQINVGKIIQFAQKAVILASFFSMIAMILYSFIFMTPFYDIYIIDQSFLFTNMSKYGLVDAYKAQYEGITDAFSYNVVTGNMNGMSLKYFTNYTRNNGLQIFNHWIFNFGFIGLLVSLVPFVVFSQKRKRYYISNYVVNGISAVFSLYVGLSLILNAAVWKNYVAGQNFEIINAYKSYMNDAPEIVEYFSFEKVKWVFDVGTVIGIIIIVIAALIVAMTVCKFLYQRKLPKIDFSEVKINE